MDLTESSSNASDSCTQNDDVLSVTIRNTDECNSEMKDLEKKNQDRKSHFTHYFVIQTSEEDKTHVAFKTLSNEHKSWFPLEIANERRDDTSDEPSKEERNFAAVMDKVTELKRNGNFPFSCIAVYPNFFDESFWKLVKAGCRIISPFLVLNTNQLEADTQRMKRYLFTIGMRQMVVCFTGFRDKQKVEEMGRLITTMGGSLRSKMGCEITHLVAPLSSGIKFRFAQTNRIPVVSSEWIYAAWARRHEPEFFRPSAAASMASNFLIRPFSGCKLSFFGFPDKELAEVIQLTQDNGGDVADVSDADSDPSVTHIVVFDTLQRGGLTGLNCHPSCEVVRVEWFWTCLQKQYLERNEPFRMNLPHLVTSPLACSRVSSSGMDTVGSENQETPRSRRSGVLSAKAQRRSRHAEFSDRLVHLATSSIDNLSSPMSVIGRDSISYTSILDATGESVGMENEPLESVASPQDPVKMSTKTPDSSKKRRITPRFGKAMELIHTESNYVDILKCMVSIIKREILDPDQLGGPILSERDAEIVFRDLDPLLLVHTRLHADLVQVANESQWTNDTRGEKIEIGAVMLRHLDEIKRVYPSFVNFYDQRKETVEALSKKYSRFHAYLRRCQSRKETGRNSIIELMIRPVQRLPSMMLILQDLLKHTDESLPDHKLLTEAVPVLKSVLSSINEDKRRTEGFLAVFNVVHSIDGCPADLASSHRHFLSQVDVVEVTNKLSDIGQPLTVFLFSDQLEICRRKRATNLSRNGSLRSNDEETMSAMSTSTVSISSAVASSGNALTSHPSTPGPNLSSVGSGVGKKKFKHVMLLSLSEVECTTDLRKDVGSDDEYRAFALVMKKKTMDVPNEVYAFAVTDDTDKLQFLRTVAQQILITTCKNGTPDSLINEMGAGTFNIDIEEAFHRHTFSGKAKRLRQRVSRVLSFTRTPRRMKRAVSHLPTSNLANADTASIASMESPSTADLRLAGTPMEISYTPSRGQELGYTRSYAALTPTRSSDMTSFANRKSACALPLAHCASEIFRETRGVDPDALFPSSPPTPEHLPSPAECTGRPSLASRFHQRFSNYFRRSISAASSSRMSIVSNIDINGSEKRKRARLSSIFSGGSNSRSKNSNGLNGSSQQQQMQSNSSSGHLYAVKESQRSSEDMQLIHSELEDIEADDVAMD